MTAISICFSWHLLGRVARPWDANDPVYPVWICKYIQGDMYALGNSAAVICCERAVMYENYGTIY